MAHWIIEDKGFGGQVFQCSNCGDLWNDIFHSEVGCWDKCPSCGEEMDEEREYVEENPLKKIADAVGKIQIPKLDVKMFDTSAFDKHIQEAKRREELVSRLEELTGMSLESLVEKFAAGWTLKEPEVVTGLHAFEINESIAKEINDMIRRDGYLRAGEPVIRRPLVVDTGYKFDEELLKRQLEDRKIHGHNLTGLGKAGMQRGMRAKICMVDDLTIDFDKKMREQSDGMSSEEKPEESED